MEPALAIALSEVVKGELRLATRRYLKTVEAQRRSVDFGNVSAWSPRFLMLHYFGGSSREWDGIALALANRGCSGTAYDARGHGLSSPMADYSVNAMADDAALLVQEPGFHQRAAGWFLVGHSMGGKVALDLASRQPEGLLGLILIAPSPPTPQPMSDAERQEEIDSYGDAAASEKTAEKIAVVPLPNPARAMFVEDNLRTAKGAWLAWNQSGTREDISSEMPKIQLPALLVTGGQDPVIAHDVYESEIAARLPRRPEQMVIHEGGHLITMTHAELIADKIAEWIQSLRP